MSLLSNGTIDSEPSPAYDHQGAAMYIAVILVWYSSGLAMMLFLQVRPRSFQQQFLFDRSGQLKKPRPTSSTANPFSKYRNVPTDNNTKQVLNELKDPERRQRLWKIYYASTEKQNEPDPQYYQTLNGDSATIDRINRKLADIHRIDTINKDDDLSAPATISSTSDTRLMLNFESSKFFAKRFPALRRPPAVNGQNNGRAVATVAESPESEPFVNGSNASRRRNLFANRFTVEKVVAAPRRPSVKNDEEAGEEWKTREDFFLFPINVQNPVEIKTDGMNLSLSCQPPEMKYVNTMQSTSMRF